MKITTAALLAVLVSTAPVAGATFDSYQHEGWTYCQIAYDSAPVIIDGRQGRSDEALALSVTDLEAETTELHLILDLGGGRRFGLQGDDSSSEHLPSFDVPPELLRDIGKLTQWSYRLNERQFVTVTDRPSQKQIAAFKKCLQ